MTAFHARDLVGMLWHLHQNPRPGEVYNAGGGRRSNVSMMEAIAKSEAILGVTANVTYSDTARIGDHIWYISDLSKFERDYPEWVQEYDIDTIIREIAEVARERAQKQ